MREESISCFFEEKRIDHKNLEIVTQKCKNENQTVILKIETFKKTYNIRYTATLQIVTTNNDIQYYIDTIESSWLIDQNQLMIDSLILNKSEDTKLCGTALIELESKDFPIPNEQKISQESANKLLRDWSEK